MKMTHEPLIAGRSPVGGAPGAGRGGALNPRAEPDDNDNTNNSNDNMFDNNNELIHMIIISINTAKCHTSDNVNTNNIRAAILIITML